jgi:hypothetical protein
MSSHSLSSVPTDRQVWIVDSLTKDNYNIECMIVLETRHHIHIQCQVFPQTDRSGLFIVFINDKMEEMEETCLHK